jgi:hypothetical protein
MDHGPDLYRRSLYSFWKRMVILPNMDAFDAPDRGSSCTRRQRTDTPLQALVAMNDPLWLEASRHLAERVLLQRRLDRGAAGLPRPAPPRPALAAQGRGRAGR